MKSVAFARVAGGLLLLLPAVLHAQQLTCPRLTVNPATHADGSLLAPGQYVDPIIPSAGGTHFAVRNKGDGDTFFDDGVIVAGSSLQLGGKSKTRSRVRQPVALEILVAFNLPVTVHSIAIYDPQGDARCNRRLPNTGKISIYGRKGLINVIDLPSNANGAEIIPLGDVPDVVKMIIDTGDGCWKSVDLVEITAPCDENGPIGRGSVVGGGALSNLSPEMRDLLKNIAERENKKFEYPECLGTSVEDCIKIVEDSCHECVGRVKPATPRVFNYYRIWIFCDENGRVVGAPRRG